MTLTQLIDAWRRFDRWVVPVLPVPRLQVHHLHGVAGLYGGGTVTISTTSPEPKQTAIHEFCHHLAFTTRDRAPLDAFAQAWGRDRFRTFGDPELTEGFANTLHWALNGHSGWPIHRQAAETLRPLIVPWKWRFGTVARTLHRGGTNINCGND